MSFRPNLDTIPIELQEDILSLVLPSKHDLHALYTLSNVNIHFNGVVYNVVKRELTKSEIRKGLLTQQWTRLSFKGTKLIDKYCDIARGRKDGDVGRVLAYYREVCREKHTLHCLLRDLEDNTEVLEQWIAASEYKRGQVTFWSRCCRGVSILFPSWSGWLGGLGYVGVMCATDMIWAHRARRS